MNSQQALPINSEYTSAWPKAPWPPCRASISAINPQITCVPMPRSTTWRCSSGMGWCAVDGMGGLSTGLAHASARVRRRAVSRRQSPSPVREPSGRAPLQRRRFRNCCM
jgi:hypothetical protein